VRLPKEEGEAGCLRRLLGKTTETKTNTLEAWHLRIKYDPPIITGEHWDVLIAWKRRYTPSFTEAVLNPAISSSRNGITS
jgi:hypothetical protein